MGVCTTKVGIPVSWQIGPPSSAAMSIFDRMISSACEDCVFGVSDSETNDMAARTSGGRLVEVWVISSSRLLGRNCICFILEGEGEQLQHVGGKMPSVPFCGGLFPVHALGGVIGIR